MKRSSKKLYNFLVQIAGTKAAIEIHNRFQGVLVMTTTKEHPFCKVLESLTDKFVLNEFMKKYGGQQLYIGKIDYLLRPIRNEEIIRKYDGTNVRDLAREFSLSEARIGQIVRNKRQEYKNSKK